MATHPALQARRALVKLILVIASVYRVVLDLNCESCDGDVLKAFKKVLLKAHPDKGGSEEHAKQLNTAKGTGTKPGNRMAGQLRSQTRETPTKLFQEWSPVLVSLLATAAPSSL